jgi:protein-tyrosine phosphatase
MPSHRAVEGESPFGVLFVCTGNICRSPIAERLTRAYLDEAVGADAALVRIESAGTRAVVGSGVHPDSSAVLTSLGGDPGGFVARQLTDGHAAVADLTLTLTRAHRRSVLNRAPRALSRTFTLREAADLALLVPSDVDLPGDTFPDRCRSFVNEMAAARARRATDAHDDIADPIGQPATVHSAVGDEIADAVLRLFRRFAAVSPAVSGAGLRAAESTNLFLSGR